MTTWAIEVQHKTDYIRDGRWYCVDQTTDGDQAVALFHKYSAPITDRKNHLGAFGANKEMPARPVRITIL